MKKKKIDELQKKHDKEMTELTQRLTKDGDSEKEEIEELQKKHREEIDDMKSKLLIPVSSRCSIV